MVDLYGPDPEGPHPLDGVLAAWLCPRIEWLVIYDDESPEHELVADLAAAGDEKAAEVLRPDSPVSVRDYAVRVINDFYTDSICKAWLYDRAAEMGAVPRFSELRDLLRSRR